MRLKLLIDGTRTDSRVFGSPSEIAPAVAEAHRRGDRWDVIHDEGSRPLVGGTAAKLVEAVTRELLRGPSE